MQVGEQVPDLRAEITRACAPDSSNWPRPGAPAGSGSRATCPSVDHTPLAATGCRDRSRALTRIVEQLREVKDEGEIELLRRACAAADDALATARRARRPASRSDEREVARELEWLMFEHGADGISFETIVATGPNSAVPHHRPPGRCSRPATS